MKVVFLITLMFVLVVVHGQNPRPCQRNPNNNAYNDFVRKHILRQNFHPNSNQDWTNYLQKNRLCDRPRQTFMEKKDQFQVEQICQGQGWRFDSYSNLCISNSHVFVHDLTVNTRNCQIITWNSGLRYVVVACDAIANVCRPVHFQTSTNNRPSTKHGRCR